jgi:O-antigen ligase
VQPPRKAAASLAEPATPARLGSSPAVVRHRLESSAGFPHHRFALMVVLVAAAMPVRLADSFPLVHSVSVLDILLIIAAATLFLDLAFRPLDPGYRTLFRILLVPVLVSFISLAWSQDRGQTVRSLLIYLEGLIAYLFVVRELNGLRPSQIMTYIGRYGILLVIPGVLLLLHVPGFAPRVPPNLSHSAGDYLSFYSRFSHPVLGRSNNIAAVLAFFPALLIYWGQSRRIPAATLSGVVTAIAVFLTLSRGTLLSFVVGGLIYAALPRATPGAATSRWRRTVITVLAAGALAVAALYVANPATHDFFSGRLGSANINGRFSLISMAVPKLAARPWLGYGAGVTPDADPKLAEGVHDTYLQQALYFGLPLALVVSLALWAIPAFFLSRRRASPIAGVIGYTIMVQLLSFIFESSLEGTVLRVLFYLSVGLGAALLRSVEAERPEAALVPAPRVSGYSRFASPPPG